MAKKTADEILELFQPNEFLYSDEEDNETAAKVDQFEEHETSTLGKNQRSSLRIKNVALLDDLDERYAGTKVSRKMLENEGRQLKGTKAARASESIEDEDDEDTGLSSDDDVSMGEDEQELESEESGEDSAGLEHDSIKTYSKGARAEEHEHDDEDNSDDEDDEDGGGMYGSDVDGSDSPGSGSEVGESDAEDEGVESLVSEKEKQSEIEKGRATQRQLRIWDMLLETRIKLQKVLVESNKLPQCDDFDSIVKYSLKLEEKPQELVQATQTCKASLKLFLDNLLELQNVLLSGNNETIDILGTKRKLQGDTKDTHVQEDEEITSSEDELNDGKKDVSPSPDVESKTNGVSHQAPKPKRFKKRKIEEYEKEVITRYNSFKGFRDQTIQKWNEKTQLATGKLAKKNFGAFQISALKQIEQILADRERLRKRTQLKRSQYEVIGKTANAKDTTTDENQVPPANSDDKNSDDVNYDPEIFDDDDFYHQLLRELIEKKTSDVTDPIELSRHWLQLQKLRSKMKRKVDTKASKGRKIRYDVHTKLVNFMAPFDMCPMTENAVSELFTSLFGSHNANFVTSS